MMTRQFPASADRQVALGAACWVLTVVFFVGQAENVSLGLHALGAVFGIAGANVGVLLLRLTLGVGVAPFGHASSTQELLGV